MKTCSKCGLAKPYPEFEKKKVAPDGHRGTCRACDNARRRQKYAVAVGGAPLAKLEKEINQAALVEPEKTYDRDLAGRTRFLVTSAQNCTPVHGPFLDTLKVAAAELGAELVVVPARYKNPTQPDEWQRWRENPNTGKREPITDWWAEEVEPYLCNQRKHLGPDLMLCGDVRIQATGMSPLTGFESLTGRESCIIGHPKMQLKRIAVPGCGPKLLTTTGAVTQRNYSDTKAGRIGEFHHFLGAIFVEVAKVDGEDLFWVWQINADREDGSFTHINRHYTANGSAPANPALGLVLGDTHHGVHNLETDQATFGPGGIVEVTNPEKLVWEDLLDGATVNPHEKGNVFLAAARMKAGRSSVAEEVRGAITFAAERSRGRAAYIVGSNHNDFLNRWLLSHDWRVDPKNAEFYLETALAIYRTATYEKNGGTYGDAFAYWCNRLAPELNVLDENDSLLIADIECGLHGHAGPGGAKGTVKNLSRLGRKVISAHGHSEAIEEGHYRVGTSSEKHLAYQVGPNASTNTHCLIYDTGARCLFTIHRGHWRAPASRPSVG